MTAGGLLDDLLNIEVDVVVGSALDRGEMPLPNGDRLEAAIGETLEGYVAWLDVHAPVIDARWRSLTTGDTAGAGEPSPAPRRAGGLALALERVSERAARAARQVADLVEADQTIDPRWPSMLRRIGGNALQLAAVAAGEVDEPVDRIRIVRKAWELGTGTIVAQTVVQLDGDAVSRFDDGVMLDDGRATLRTLHRDAVRGSLEHWRLLVDLLVELVRTLQTLLRALWPPGVAFGAAPAGGSSIGDLWRARSHILSDWGDFRREVLPLFSQGGATIESSDGVAPYARTVIQADGDALWFVSDTAVDDDALLRAHVDRVGEWFEVARSSMRAPQQAIAAARDLLASVLAVVGIALGIWRGVADGWVAAAVVIGVTVLVVILAWLGLRLVLGRRLRDKLGLSGV